MLNLIPYPSGTAQENRGTCRIPDVMTADLGGFERWSVIAFENRMGASVVEGGSWLRLFRDEKKAPEGYSLGITPEGISIGASTEQGIIWALTTLACLADQGSLPCCLIQDEPRYAHRGLNLDCSRHFFSAEEVKKVIEGISLAKMNVLHWHLSDDQGWRIESKVFPKLNKNGEYYTQNQIRNVVEFARLRGVEVIPEIDMPGHTSAILAAFPNLSCSGKPVPVQVYSGIFPIILCPGEEETFTFLEALLGEIAPLFPSSRFHIGGDEAPKSEWKKCPACAARMKALGLSDYEDLQGWFTGRIGEILCRYGKTPICWNETLLASNAPADIQVQYWILSHRDSMERFAKAGGKWIYSDMFEFYFDYPYSMTPMERVYKTVPHLGRQDITADPNLLGLECCLWTEHVVTPERLENLLFPRVLAFAELCWEKAGDYAQFQARAEAIMAHSLYRNFSFTDRSWWNPSGKARRKDAFAFLDAQKASMGDDPPAAEGAPNKEFAQAFRQKFFRPADLPFLLMRK